MCATDVGNRRSRQERVDQDADCAPVNPPRFGGVKGLGAGDALLVANVPMFMFAEGLLMLER